MNCLTASASIMGGQREEKAEGSEGRKERGKKRGKKRGKDEEKERHREAHESQTMYIITGS